MIFAANVSFMALSTIGCLAKGVLYGLNLIGEWIPVSILILTVCVFPKSVSFSAKRSTLCSIKSCIKNCFSMIKRHNYFLPQIIKKTHPEGSLLFLLVQIINIYKVTSLHFFSFASAFLSRISLLVLLTINTKNVPCLLVFTVELAVSRPVSLLMVLSSVGIT